MLFYFVFTSLCNCYIIYIYINRIKICSTYLFHQNITFCRIVGATVNIMNTVSIIVHCKLTFYLRYFFSLLSKGLEYMRTKISTCLNYCEIKRMKFRSYYHKHMSTNKNLDNQDILFILFKSV